MPNSKALPKPTPCDEIQAKAIYGVAMEFQATVAAINQADEDLKLATMFTANIIYSFECELLLKCVSALTKSEYRKIHDLRILYDDLDSTTQTRLEEIWDAIPPDPFFVALGRHTTLKQRLQDSANFFDAWRYRFEGRTNLPTSTPSQAAIPLVRMILSLRPLWNDNSGFAALKEKQRNAKFIDQSDLSAFLRGEKT